jgi:long-subunit fatty acid transport protein
VLGNDTGNVADSFLQSSLGFKADLNDKLSYAVIIDTPFAADIEYGGSPATTMLGGTTAKASSTALTGLLRYKFDDRTSVYGGLRLQQAAAHIDLRGLGYGALNGYSVDLGTDNKLGYVVGAAYEIPDIALRVALTYNSEIEHNFETVETVGPFPFGAGKTKVKTPQSVNLDFQSGIAKDTLIFGSIRWADWSSFTLNPASFTAVSPGGLIDLEDTVTYTLGIGRKFNETWAGAFSLTYEDEANPLVSPLAPTNGFFGATIAGVYSKDNMKITAGVNYTKLGDAKPETGTPDVARANFTDNDAVGVGVKIAFTF